MIPYIFFIGPIIFVLALLIGLSLRQFYNSKEFLKKLDKFNLKSIEISYSQTSIDKGSVIGGMSFKTMMYYTDKNLSLTLTRTSLRDAPPAATSRYQHAIFL
jgi:hypothetical protein